MNCYKLLGPLVVEVNGRQAALRSRRQRTVLALLLLNLGRVTLTEQLLYGLWGDTPPDTAIGQIQTVVWRLRGILGDMAITTHPGGYLLSTEDTEVDAVRFAEGVARGSALASDGLSSESAAEFADALALWRGDPMADVALTGDPAASGFRAAVAELIEKRVAAERAYIDLEFALGHHTQLVPMLHQLWERDPLREEVAGRLMVALHRSSRRNEALDVYRRTRETIVAELGLEPGPELNAVNNLVLTGSSEVDPVEVKRPSQLPIDLPTFVARHELAGKLASVLTTTGGHSPPIVAVSGTAGSGKTALAVHAAHLAREGFPDGQLFADLRGAGEPADPGEVLAQFLRALGQDPRAIPNATSERASMFRDRTTGRRLLLVLDNVRGEEQVRVLLPAAPTCAVLITSRRRIAAEVGAFDVDLGLFEPHEALDLMRATLGPARVGAEQEMCLEIARRCGYLPLAIKIAAARLAARPHWTVSRLAGRLAGPRLPVLSTRDSGVRASLALSVGTLEPGARDLFARLGAVEPTQLPGWAGAALLGIAPGAAEDLLEELVDARLVDAIRCPGGSTGYRMHDLVWEYAREIMTTAAPPADLSRWYGAWLTLADVAYQNMPGGFQRVAPIGATRWSCWTDAELAQWFADPVAWCEDHRATLVDVVRDAAANAPPETAWNLAVTLARFFETREHLDDWRVTHEVALRACTAASDRVGEAYVMRGLGELYLNLDQYAQALRHLDPALSMMEEIGDARGTTTVLRAAATAHRMLGQHDQAMAVLTRARAISAGEGDPVAEAQVLHSIGAVHRTAGRLEQAEDSYRQALAVFDRIEDRFGQSFVLCSLGLVAGQAPNRATEAEGHFRRSLELARELGYRRGEAIALGNLGDLYQRIGRSDRAIPELIAAIELCREIRDTMGEMIELRRLGESYLDTQRPSAARSVLSRSLSLAVELELPDDQTRLRSLLSRAVPADA